jgi:hypothetical protein
MGFVVAGSKRIPIGYAEELFFTRMGRERDYSPSVWTRD